ncbi:MAG TPA: hypothetical protein PKD92_07670 [Novosphingobium sp.]|nr:hypothetical protein [Novosphingobium sp.]
MGRFTMIALTNAKPGRDAEFVEWYDNVHLAQMLSVPGVMTAQRCKLADIPAAGTPRWGYAGIYTIEADDPAPVFEAMMRRYQAGEMTPCDAMVEVSYNGIFLDAPVLVRR